MNAGIWMGIIGGIIGLSFALVSVLQSGGKTGIYISLALLLSVGGMFYLFYRLFFKPMINTARLQKKGLPGKARILEVRDTGVTINNNPQVKLVLEVKNSLGQKYHTECRVLVSRITPGAYQPGMEVPVKIDPRDEKNVVLDFSGSSATQQHSFTSTNTDALIQELEKVQEENNSIGASGRSARAIIKKCTWLGANVNGSNPYVELELEVLPENSPSFSGKARGVIAEASVHKYQPGQEILVKYDLYDNSRVVIDHS